MQQLNLQLYGRTTKKTFSEQLSARKSVTLTPQPARIELPLRAPGREKFVEFRLDPDDKPSTFILHELRVRSQDDVEAFRWDGSPESLNGPIDLRAWIEGENVLIETQSNDPFVLIPFPEPLGGSLVLEITVSQNLGAPDLADSGPAISALSAHQQEIAEAVRSLQGSLRKALDDLASEQEGLQDALVAHHAHARSESDTVRRELTEAIGRTDVALKRTAGDLNALESTFTVALSETARETKGAIEGVIQFAANEMRAMETRFAVALSETRDAVLSEVRDDWRALSHQIRDRAEAISKESSDREAAISAAREVEFSNILVALERLAKSQRIMEKVRAELGIFRDEDAPVKLQQLKAEAQAAREQVEKYESSLLGRLMRPFYPSARKSLRG